MTWTFLIIKVGELRQNFPALELGIPTSYKGKQTHWKVKGVGNTLQWNMNWWEVESLHRFVKQNKKSNIR